MSKVSNKSIAMLTVTKVIVEETPIACGNGTHQTIGQLIDGYISNEIAASPTTIIQDVSISFEHADWLVYRELHGDTASPLKQALRDHAAIAVPATTTEAEATTNKKVDKANLYYIYTVDSHEYFGPFYSHSSATTWGNNNKKNFQVVRTSEMNTYDRQNARSVL